MAYNPRIISPRPVTQIRNWREEEELKARAKRNFASVAPGIFGRTSTGRIAYEHASGELNAKRKRTYARSAPMVFIKRAAAR